MASDQESSFPAASSLESSSDTQHFDYTFKFVIVGNTAVGKTALLLRYCDNTFPQSIESTVGIDFKVKTVLRQEKQIRLQIWDTAGMERYRTLTHTYYRGGMGFVLMFDLTREETFASVNAWFTAIQQYASGNSVAVLVGNKCELNQRAVSTEQAEALANQLGLRYLETSAKDNINVKETFDILIDASVANVESFIEVSGEPSVTPHQDSDPETPSQNYNCPTCSIA